MSKVYHVLYNVALQQNSTLVDTERNMHITCNMSLFQEACTHIIYDVFQNLGFNDLHWYDAHPYFITIVVSLQRHRKRGFLIVISSIVAYAYFGGLCN